MSSVFQIILLFGDIDVIASATDDFASATVYFAPIEYILNAIRNTRASQKKTGGLYCVTTGGAIGCAFRCNYHAGI